jgi:acetylornithine/succinyldiaminopimelate/putrescine aminotransferase
MLEPIQGESGVYPATSEYLRKARELCDKHNALLIFDEVQCGMGRTGQWWAHQVSGVSPDVMTTAKALGSGFPVGACLAHGRAAKVFAPGDHGSTYAGNPLACSAALATINAIESGDLRTNAQDVGGYLISELSSSRFEAHVAEVRGSGFMVGIQLSSTQAKRVAAAAMERGLIINAIGDEILRLLPPLISTAEHVDQALITLQEVFDQ